MSTNRLYGYARVSSKEQNLNRQVNDLLNAGVLMENILQEKQSGADLERPVYQELKKYIRPGDILIICELDRLSRDYEDLKTEYQYFKDNKIGIQVLEQEALSTVGKSDLEAQLISNVIFELMSYLAQKEREKIKQRQRDGILAAKKVGKHLGRPRAKRHPEFVKYYTMWVNNEITAEEAQKLTNTKRTTFYKFARELRHERELLQKVDM